MRIKGEVDIKSLFQKLKHDGRWLLSSVSKYHVAASVLGVTGLIFAIKDGNSGYISDLLLKTERDDASNKLQFIAGLHNLGNNCFLNVVLQALASCESFKKFIESLIEEDGFSVEEMPLTAALAALFVELCIPHDKRISLSPQKVMLAMDDYIPSFNLTRQQDAEEAFLHLLSSLREELSECFVPHCCSLANIYAFSQSRIYSPSWGHTGEQQKWQQFLLGPFDGILCSTLACRSCASQLSMSYEFFHSLSVSPILDYGDTVLQGSSIENCLKKFTAAELIENYRCNRCWHNSAIKYLFAIEGDESQIEKVKCCVKEDSCDCRNLLSEKAKLWSNNCSHAVRQLRVARCPEEIPLKLNEIQREKERKDCYGQVIMVLQSENIWFKRILGQMIAPASLHVHECAGTELLDTVQWTVLCIQLKRASVNKFGESVKLQGHISFPMILDLSPFTKDSLRRTMEDLKDNFTDTKVGGVKKCIYQLVSVVEHFGNTGSGHYTVYRRLKHDCWFCASDSKVFSVSEEDVLSAEASLLFYERLALPQIHNLL